MKRLPRSGLGSEHPCRGWLEGYLLTGRHGMFNCYEAFVHIVDSMFNQHAKSLAVRVVNVVDIMRLQPATEHPHGLPDNEFDALFTRDKPVIFAYHGYSWLIHRLNYSRANHDQMHVRGYRERGTTTTPFDMVMLNNLDRFHLVMDVLDRVPGLGARHAVLRQQMVDARLAGSPTGPGDRAQIPTAAR